MRPQGAGTQEGEHVIPLPEDVEDEARAEYAEREAARREAAERLLPPSAREAREALGRLRGEVAALTADRDLDARQRSYRERCLEALSELERKLDERADWAARRAEDERGRGGDEKAIKAAVRRADKSGEYPAAVKSRVGVARGLRDDVEFLLHRRSYEERQAIVDAARDKWWGEEQKFNEWHVRHDSPGERDERLRTLRHDAIEAERRLAVALSKVAERRAALDETNGFFGNDPFFASAKQSEIDEAVTFAEAAERDAEESRRRFNEAVADDHSRTARRLRRMETGRRARLEREAIDPYRGVPEFKNSHEARMWAARNLTTEIGPLGKAGMDVVRETFSAIKGWEERLGTPIPASVSFDTKRVRRAHKKAAGICEYPALAIWVREFKTAAEHADAKASGDAHNRALHGKPWTVGSGLESLVVHEAGHAVDFKLRNSLRIEALSGMTEGWDPGTVSGYSAKDEAEAFTEAFTAVYLDTPEAKYVPPRLREKIERMIYPDDPNERSRQ